MGHPGFLQLLALQGLRRLGADLVLEASAAEAVALLEGAGTSPKTCFVCVTCVVSRHSQARQSSRSASAVPWPRGDSLRFSRVRLPARLWEVALAAATAPMASAVRAGFFDTSQLPKFRRGKNLERHEGGKSTAGKLPLLTSHCPGAVSSCGCCKDGCQAMGCDLEARKRSLPRNETV